MNDPANDTIAELLETNLPFERLPTCACDPGSGPRPTRLQRLECRMRGGPCSGQWNAEPEHPQE